MRKTLVTGIVVALAAVGIAEENLEARLDKLLYRWSKGDEATRAGVVAETHALGERAIAELYRRLARKNGRDMANELGTRLSAVELNPDSRLTVLVESAFTAPRAGVEFPERPTLLTAEQADHLTKDGEVTTAPSIVCYDSQRANLSITNEEKYTRTFDPRRRNVPGTVSSGVHLDVRPVLIEGTNRLSLELRCVRARVEGDAVPTLQTDEGEIGMPIVTKREFAVTLVVDSGEGVAIALPGKEPLVLRLTATRLKQKAR